MPVLSLHICAMPTRCLYDACTLQARFYFPKVGNSRSVTISGNTPNLVAVLINSGSSNGSSGSRSSSSSSSSNSSSTLQAKLYFPKVGNARSVTILGNTPNFILVTELVLCLC